MMMTDQKQTPISTPTSSISIPTISAEARPSAGPFVETNVKVGTLCSKTWRAPFDHGVTTLWAERCAKYWAWHGLRHGVVWSDHRNAYDEITSTITTFATPMAILPGKRYPAHELPAHLN